jgi:hypothetical protein
LLGSELFSDSRGLGKFRDPSAAKLVQPVKDPWLEALQDHVIGMLELPVRSEVCHGCPIHMNMVIVAEIKELFTSELRAVVGDDGVWDLEAMDNVGKEEHRLLGFDSRDWPSFDPL